MELKDRNILLEKALEQIFCNFVGITLKKLLEQEHFSVTIVTNNVHPEQTCCVRCSASTFTIIDCYPSMTFTESWEYKDDNTVWITDALQRVKKMGAHTMSVSFLTKTINCKINV